MSRDLHAALLACHAARGSLLGFPDDTRDYDGYVLICCPSRGERRRFELSWSAYQEATGLWFRSSHPGRGRAKWGKRRKAAA